MKPEKLTIEIEYEELDKAIEKAEILKQKLDEIVKIINSDDIKLVTGNIFDSMVKELKLRGVKL
jgi:hypothetical protein